jgi:hypothetical protein
MITPVYLGYTIDDAKALNDNHLSLGDERLGRTKKLRVLQEAHVI